MNIYGHDIELIDTEGEIVTDVIVLARTVRHDDDGCLQDSLIVSTTRTTTYMLQAGMIQCAAEAIGGDE